jgi:acetylornithine deacetylase
MTTDTTPTIQPRRLRALLRSLIDIYSPSGKEEDIVDFLHVYLKRRKLPVVRQSLEDDRDNLLIMPRQSDVSVVLVGHVDTVPAYDLDDYEYERDGDTILGLGAADMKGGCAAMVEAFLSLWEHCTAPPPVAMALLVGEEEEGDGAQRLVEDFHAPWAIIGEPTELRPCLSHYGYIEIQMVVRGRRVHASLANLRPNPIQIMLYLISKIADYITQQQPELVYNVRDMFSSQAGYVVPEWCEAWLDVHLPPLAPIGEVTMELEELLTRDYDNDPEVDVTVKFVTIDAGYELPEKGPIVEVLKDVYARKELCWEPGAFRSHSDANQLWAAGIKPILLGPGSLEHSHMPEESVAFTEVRLAAELYLDTLRALAG